MNVTQVNGVVADSAAIKPASLNSVIISRTTIDFGSIDAFRVDSSRLVAKKTTPVIKTIPYVPANDTIDHPAYDVLTGEFVIAPHDSSIAAQLRINPIAPIDGSSRQAAIEAVTPVHATQTPVASSPARPVLIEQPDSQPAADTPAVVIAVNADTAVVQLAGADTAAAAVSDTTAADSLVLKPAQKVFTEKDGNPITRKTSKIVLNDAGETDWMVGVVILSCILFAWSRMIYGKYISMLMQSAVNFFTARRVYEESNVVRMRVYFLLNILFFINIGVFATQAANLFNINIYDLAGIAEFGVWVGGFMAFYLIRTIILKLLDFIFDTDKFGAYNFSIYIYNKVYGMFLLPLIAAIPFVPGNISEKLVWIGLALFALFYVLTLFRGLRICIKNRVSIFYLFFYLCALEIIPLMTIYKFVSTFVE